MRQAVRKSKIKMLCCHMEEQKQNMTNGDQMFMLGQA